MNPRTGAGEVAGERWRFILQYWLYARRRDGL